MACFGDDPITPDIHPVSYGISFSTCINLTDKGADIAK